MRFHFVCFVVFVCVVFAHSIAHTQHAHSPLSAFLQLTDLILTYVVEFDRVHYPLPLKHEAVPNPVALQKTIRRYVGK
jgi:hypothetical protein